MPASADWVCSARFSGLAHLYYLEPFVKGKRISIMSHKKWLWQWIILAALCTAVFARTPYPAAAQQTAGVPGITMSARAGFDGYYRQQRILPVQVTVANSGPSVEGVLRAEVGSTIMGDRLVYTAPISLPTQSNKRVTLLLNVPNYLATITVELRDDNGRLLHQVVSNSLSLLPSDGLLYGVVSEEPGKLEFLQRVTGGRTGASVAFLALPELPETAVAWEALDILIFHDVDTAQLTARQQEALQIWLRAGGQLVLTGGAGWQKTTAAFADLLPVTINGSQSVPDLPALAAQIGEPFRDPGPYIIASSSLRSGDLLYHQAGLPILARQAVGRGAVYFLALDPRLAPLVDWAGAPTLWTAVAANVPRHTLLQQGIQNGYSAHMAVTTLPSLALPSTLGLAAFLFLYVIAVGPVNYWVLKRRGRRELAWLTVPALVLLFSVIAYFTGFQIKGNQVILNQMSIVYGRVGGEPVRVQSLISLYSPGRATYDLILPEDVNAYPLNRSYGNLLSSGSLDAIARGSDLVLQRVRVDVSGVEAFLAEAYRPGLPLMAQVNLTAQDNQFTLTAVVQNNSDVPLQNVTLLFGSRAFSLGDLPAGAQKTLAETMSASALSSSSASSGPMYGPYYASSPLVMNADKILGTPDYYSDSAIYPRYQLLEALSRDPYGTTAVAQTAFTDTILLTAWADIPQMEVNLREKQHLDQFTTLYLLEVPLTQNLGSGSQVTVPMFMLNWSVLASNNVYGATIQNFSMNMGSVDFAYVPWAQFQQMEVTRLELVLQPTYASATNYPELFLWDWQTQTWVNQPVIWGVTEVKDYGRYLGLRNEVRIRLSTNQYGIEIGAVYPQLTGIIR